MTRLDREGIGMTSRRTRERLVARLREQGISDPRVLEAVASTPRHLFVEEALSHRAYEDTALPIGHGQTISQPLVVAMMTEAVLAGGRPVQKVLEVGTGCGYQSAVLAPLVERLFSIERIEPLYQRARRLLHDLQLRNVRLRHGDGMLGWPQEAPFDAILVAAAPEQVPDALREQLADGGRMVIPVGGRGVQQLTLVERQGDDFQTRVLEAVRFVPLLGGTVGRGGAPHGH